VEGRSAGNNEGRRWPEDCRLRSIVSMKRGVTSVSIVSLAGGRRGRAVRLGGPGQDLLMLLTGVRPASVDQSEYHRDHVAHVLRPRRGSAHWPIGPFGGVFFARATCSPSPISERAGLRPETLGSPISTRCRPGAPRGVQPPARLSHSRTSRAMNAARSPSPDEDASPDFRATIPRMHATTVAASEAESTSRIWPDR
jgi:hypothetical protein